MPTPKRYTTHINVPMSRRLHYALWCIASAAWGPTRYGWKEQGVSALVRTLLEAGVLQLLDVDTLDDLPDPPSDWSSRKLQADEPAPPLPALYGHVEHLADHLVNLKTEPTLLALPRGAVAPSSRTRARRPRPSAASPR